MILSVIIPVRNRPEALRRCLEGVLGNTLARERYEVLVVDNGSTDETASVARAFAGVRVVEEAVANRCLARNRGAAEARGAWLAFIDSDCIPDAGWLAGMAAAIEGLRADERVALLAGEIRPAPAESSVETFIARRRWIDQEKFLERGRRFSPPFAATANLCVKRDVYLELGGLDPALAVAGEDADFCWRAAREGWAMRYVPEAAVTHYHRSTLGGLWRQAYHYGIGNAELFAKWRGAWGARTWVEPRHAVWAMKGLAKAPVRWVTGRDAYERREPFYDFLANLAMLLGRMRGGVKRGVVVI